MTSYKTVHKRLKRARGRASEHACWDGCGNSADEWSYERSSEGSRLFSENLDDYVPRCRSCHRRHDRQRAVCTMDNCERPAKGNGLCAMHYARVFRIGSTELPPPRTCSTADCDRKHYARDLCRMHYVREQRRGFPETRHTGD